MGTTKLPQPMEISRWGTESKIFSDVKQLIRWAEGELGAWGPDDATPAKFGTSKTIWQKHRGYFKALRDHAQNLASKFETDLTDEQRSAEFQNFRNNVAGVIQAISNGDAITSDHPDYAHIKALAKSDIEAAGLFLLSALREGAAYISNAIDDRAGRLIFVRHSLSPMKCAPEYAESLSLYSKQIANLKDSLDAELVRHGELNETWKGDLGERNNDFIGAENTRNTSWSNFLGDTKEQWSNSLKIYTEKMALAAPVTYWTSRAKASKWAAIAYAALFAILISVGITVFVQLGIPHLNQMSGIKGVSVLVAVLPVLVPAFAGVWLLRMVGRLLSENIQLMQNATERATMVQTFLALVNDEVHGKSLVTDDDRILILHSLFRPSSISAADDSPPVNWFDILSRKLGGKP